MALTDLYDQLARAREDVRLTAQREDHVEWLRQRQRLNRLEALEVVDWCARLDIWLTRKPPAPGRFACVAAVDLEPGYLYIASPEFPPRWIVVEVAKYRVPIDAIMRGVENR